MIKNIVASVIVALLLTCGAIFENDFVSRQFIEYQTAVDTVYQKVVDKTAVKKDAENLRENWLDKKKYLHAFIPHNEIKEVELWVSEAVSLIGSEMWDEALDKMEVLSSLIKEIPSAFKISIENIL